MRGMKAEEAGPIITKFIKQALVSRLQCASAPSCDYHMTYLYNSALPVSHHTLLQPPVTLSSGQEMASLLKTVQKSVHTAKEYVPCMESTFKLNLLIVSPYTFRTQKHAWILGGCLFVNEAILLIHWRVEPSTTRHLYITICVWIFLASFSWLFPPYPAMTLSFLFHYFLSPTTLTYLLLTLTNFPALILPPSIPISLPHLTYSPSILPPTIFSSYFSSHHLPSLFP